MLPSPFRSILLNTSSAICRLVPPAPSAFSNSVLVIWPSPLASIFENRSSSAALRALLVLGLAREPCDCAASRVFQVDGDSWLPAEPADVVEVDVAVVVVGFASENELAGTIPVCPLDVGDDDADEASDDNRSIADEAAPMAKNMTQDPHGAQRADIPANTGASRVPQSN